MGKDALSRWQRFYHDDPQLVNIAPSQCAQRAAEHFYEHDCRFILDLGCGAGRDSFFLEGNSAQVVGLDAARAGLSLAQEQAAAVQSKVSWVESDSRRLPFADSFFDDVYCFGLLHEFVGESSQDDVTKTMREIHRVLKPSGLVVVAVSAGDPAKGLPHVQNFSELMFDQATAAFHCVEKKVYDDLGCTGRTDYRVWFGHFVK